MWLWWMFSVGLQALVRPLTMRMTSTEISIWMLNTLISELDTKLYPSVQCGHLLLSKEPTYLVTMKLGQTQQYILLIAIFFAMSPAPRESSCLPSSADIAKLSTCGKPMAFSTACSSARGETTAKFAQGMSKARRKLLLMLAIMAGRQDGHIGIWHRTDFATNFNGYRWDVLEFKNVASTVLGKTHEHGGVAPLGGDMLVSDARGPVSR